MAFLLRSKHLLISWLQSPSAVILEPKKIKSLTVPIVSSSIYHEMMGPASAGSLKKQASSKKRSTFALLTMPKPLTVWITIKRWESLKEMGMPDHLTCLLRNLYAGQKATVRIVHGTTDWFQIGKGVRQGCILSPCLFNLYAEYIIWNAKLDEA